MIDRSSLRVWIGKPRSKVLRGQLEHDVAEPIQADRFQSFAKRRMLVVRQRSCKTPFKQADQQGSTPLVTRIVEIETSSRIHLAFASTCPDAGVFKAIATILRPAPT